MSKKMMDGVRMAVLSNRWEAISRKMANTLLRTGRSGVLATARDFSCCLVTSKDELLAAAESIPIHVLVGPDMMARSMKELHSEIRPGDAFLHNSPYHGCSHPADQSILVPVFDEAGRHRYTAVVKAHQADIGNSLPTTYMGSAVDVYNEGALIFPAVRVQRDYQDIDDIIRICRMRIRVPEQWWGDYLAAVGAARIAEREIKALAAEVGWDELEAFEQAWFDYSEVRMREAIARLPRATVTRSSTHDAMPGTPKEGIRITATVEVQPTEGRISIDLSDNPDAMPCGLNVSEACTRTAALIGVFNSIDPVPRNAGSFRCVSLNLKENGVVGIPRHPTSCSVSTTNVADRITNAVQTAFAEMAPEIGQAEVGPILPGTMAVISGRDPRRGNAPFVNQLFVVHTGGAGTPDEDAWLTIAHSGNAGMMYVDSVEIAEMLYPIQIYEKRLVADSEGAGEFIGAPGCMAEYGPVDCSMTVNFVSDGTDNPALGVRGGLSGGSAKQYRRKGDGSLEALPAVTSTEIGPEERLVAYACGGGGFGDPRDRSPERVLENVRENWITAERAREVYGVAIVDGKVDAVQTAALREPPLRKTA